MAKLTEVEIKEKEKLPCGCNADILYIEYPYPHPERYDGVSEVKCMKCEKRYGRWSGRELRGGEFENRYGRVDTGKSK